MKKIKILFSVLLLITLSILTLVSGRNEVNDIDEFFLNTKSGLSTQFSNDVKIDIADMGNMNASWYGPRFHGRLTANGEIYDQMAYTAAHKSLPFGTLLRLTNEKNNKSVVVRINDRGPYIPGRQIDLSKQVAMDLGTYNKGVVKLKVEQINISGIDVPLIN
jgi:rare lipoprotein A (peptidoglycan hydrolase)